MSVTLNVSLTSALAGVEDILLFSLSLSAISDEMTVYKFSKEKAVSWLRSKVVAQASSLEDSGVYVGTGSQSSMLVRSNKRSDISKSMPSFYNACQ